jgi:PTS system mannose-specific IID component
MISLGTRLKVFLGSFFIQASWSFNKMQGLGFVAALSPALRELYADKVERREALKRHTAYYNAHPYMASPILGAVIELEEKTSQGRSDELSAGSFKEALMGPYGSIGDGFFWGMLRPVTALVGILAAFLFGLWGVVIFLALYNLFHIWMRWSGLGWGLKYGVKVIDRVAALDLPAWTRRGRYLGSALLGVVSFVMVVEVCGLGGGEEQISAISHSLTASLKQWAPLVAELVLIVFAILLSLVPTRLLGLQGHIYVVLVLALILGTIFC